MISLRIILFYLCVPHAYNFKFSSDPENSGELSAGCGPFQECRSPSQCPSVVSDSKERNIEPKVCGMLHRSVMVCCNTTEIDSSSSGSQCGVSRTKSNHHFDNIDFLLGGQEITSYPWTAALGFRKDDGSLHWFCGGSYIGHNIILTAAHCVSSVSLDVVRLGAHDLSVEEESAEDYRVRKIVVHPQFIVQHRIPQHDIALVFLETGGSGLREEVVPVCLPPPDLDISPGSSVLVAGWGATSEGGNTADRLQEVPLQVYDQNICQNTYENITGLSLGPGVLCAGTPQGGRDACKGFGGGALLYRQKNTNNWVEVGILSAGAGCGRRDIPGIYTKLSHYVHWIEALRKELEHSSSL